MAGKYETIFFKNLSSNSDEKFKLAKIVISNDKYVYFEIRQTDRGRLTENGIIMSYPVFIRFKNNVQNRATYKLEYNNRSLGFNMNGRKTQANNQLCINQQRSPNDIRTISLDKNEQVKLFESIEQIDSQFKAKCLEFNSPIEFDDTCYFKEFTEEEINQNPFLK